MTEVSRRAALEWTELISSDEVQTFKPNAVMYRQAILRGGLDPHTTLFVAAHAWDLDAAKEHGFKTALVLRPGVGPQIRYDHQVKDLSDVASLSPVEAP